MADATRGVFAAIYHSRFVAGVVIQPGIVSAAFARRQATAVGVLVSGVFPAILLVSVVARIARSSTRCADVSFDMIMALTAARSGLQSPVTVLLAAGIPVVPASLERLSLRT